MLTVFFHLARVILTLIVENFNVTIYKGIFIMDNKNNKVFAFKAAEKNEVKQDKKWKSNSKTSTAGCSGPWARGSGPWGRDSGIWC